MKVLAYDPYLSVADVAERGGEKVELDELLLETRDVVSSVVSMEPMRPPPSPLGEIAALLTSACSSP